jgi:hypothetical protein
MTSDFEDLLKLSTPTPLDTCFGSENAEQASQRGINAWLEEEVLQQYHRDRTSVDSVSKSQFDGHGVNGHSAPAQTAATAYAPVPGVKPISSSDFAPSEELVPLAPRSGSSPLKSPTLNLRVTRHPAGTAICPAVLASADLVVSKVGADSLRSSMKTAPISRCCQEVRRAAAPLRFPGSVTGVAREASRVTSQPKRHDTIADS